MTSYNFDEENLKESTSVKDLISNMNTSSNVTEADLTKDEEFIAELIVHIFLIQDSNTHPVFRVDTSGSRNEVGMETLGSGEYPVIGSYFNHSCCPNTVRVNVGKMNYMVTSNTIKAGEEVTDIYSMHYSEIKPEDRRKWLWQSFHFQCQCRACQEDWKTFDHLGNTLF